MTLTIFALNPSHDGGIAVLEDDQLVCSIESEKDSFLRHEAMTASAVVDAFRYLSSIPDVVSIAGGIKAWQDPYLKLAVGYMGTDASSVRFDPKSLFRGRSSFHSCSHERSHLMCAYGMSPYEQGRRCYALIWEGGLGCVYSIDEDMNLTRLKSILSMPGEKYEFAFKLADKTDNATTTPSKTHFRPSDLAGKVMALAAYAPNHIQPNSAEKELIERILRISSLDEFNLELYKDTHLYHCGVHTEPFHRFAKLLSDAIFDSFYSFIKTLPEKRPLLIAGGCGLNCEWNSRFRDSGIFEDVFIPPCPNDSGIAIGAGIDALRHLTGKAKIGWTAYSGQEFVMDPPPLDTKVVMEPIDLELIASELAEGQVIAWLQGRCEIGPRALGNRSLLASPLLASNLEKLNAIKEREPYRPIAPVCLSDQTSMYFEPGHASPHMLYLHHLKTDRLPAVTHVDNSARIQTVTRAENKPLHELLSKFHELTGYGVLCNTSLNFKGRGFINTYSELIQFCKQKKIRRFVVNESQGTILP